MSNKSRRNTPPRRPTAKPVDNRTPLRKKLETYSAGPLVTLHSLPRLVVPVVMGLMLLGGLLLAGDLAWLGAVLLACVGLFILWLTALSWPVLSGGGRIARVFMLAVLAGFMIMKLQGRL